MSAPITERPWTAADLRRQPMPTPCSPWCLVRKDDPDHRRWRWCRHRRRK